MRDRLHCCELGFVGVNLFFCRRELGVFQFVGVNCFLLMWIAWVFMLSWILILYDPCRPPSGGNRKREGNEPLLGIDNESELFNILFRLCFFPWGSTNLQNYGLIFPVRLCEPRGMTITFYYVINMLIIRICERVMWPSHWTSSFFSTALPLVFVRVVLWLTPLVDSLEVTDLISDDCLNREYAHNVYNWTSRSRDTRSKASDTRAIFFSRRQRNGWNFIALPARAKWLHAQWFFGRVATITWKKNNIISIFMSDLAYIF